jgi:hypothetical protein
MRTYLTTLLLGNTDSTTSAASGLGVLTTDTETPVVTETTMSADLLQALKIITELGVDTVSENLGVLAVDNVALSVEEPGWDLVLGWVLDDGDDALELFGGKFTGTVFSIRWCSIRCFHSYIAYRLLRSTSAFLQTKLE